MKIDDSFKKPGSVPFKWEIRPGVPKLQTQSGRRQLESGSEKQHQRKQKQPSSVVAKASIHNYSFPETPTKLKPPPAGLYHMEPRTRSIRSSPATLSDRFGVPGLARPNVVSSAGCFPSSLGKLKRGNRSRHARSVPGSEYYSDLDQMSSRWSVSSRRSVSTLSPPSVPSHRSSPSTRPVCDVDWAGFALF